MSEGLTRREFVIRASLCAAGLAVGGVAPEVIAQTTKAKPPTRAIRRTTTQQRLNLAPYLEFGSPEYGPALAPVRVLTRWTPASREFLQNQRDHFGPFSKGNHYVVTLRNRSEGAAFDAVVEVLAIWALGRAGDPPRIDRVVKFKRVAAVIGDVPPNGFHDFAIRIDWEPGAEVHGGMGELRRLQEENRGKELVRSGHVVRFWHPIFDHAPASYAVVDRHYRYHGGVRPPQEARG